MILYVLDLKMLLKPKTLGMLLCCFLLFADNCSSFEFPSLQSFADVFDRLGKLMSSSKKSDTKANPSKSQRMKRQSTDIGDESTNPWEVRSSRYCINCIVLYCNFVY